MKKSKNSYNQIIDFKELEKMEGIKADIFWSASTGTAFALNDVEVFNNGNILNDNCSFLILKVNKNNVHVEIKDES